MSGFRCIPCGMEFADTKSLIAHKKENEHWQLQGERFNLPKDYKSSLVLVERFFKALQILLKKYLKELKTTKFEGLIEICNEILYFSYSDGFEQLDFVKMDMEDIVKAMKNKRIGWISMKNRDTIKTDILELLVEINLVLEELDEN